MSVWDGDKFRWFCAASEFTGFHKNLKALLKESLADCRTLADFGCGAGLLDIELASPELFVTCVDKSPEVTVRLVELALKNGNSSLETICADAETIAGSWDAVISVFYGEPDKDAVHNLKRCNKRYIAVVHGDDYGRLRPPRFCRKKRSTTESVKKSLEERGLKFQLIEASLEYGQPFLSFADAVAFEKNWCPGAEEGEINGFLMENLMSTQDRKYPLYLPYKKRLGVFVIPKTGNKRVV